MNKIFLIILYLVPLTLSGHSKEEWKSRTIYQLLTDRFAKGNGDTSPCYDLSNYCGGNFDGITNNLDYIQGMGFDAIWISPVIENVGNGYHGYWAKDFYAINDHFGGKDALHKLVRAAHNRDMWIMLDVVANHVGPVDMDFSSINPFNKAEHYHTKCQVTNYCGGDQNNVEWCRLANLPDLNQDGNSWVHDQLTKWISWIVNEYELDGIRIDTVPYVYKDFWSDFTRASGVYSVGEVFCPNNLGYMAPYLDHIDGLLNYGIFNQLRNSFKGGSFWDLSNAIKAEESNSKFSSHSNYLGNFVDNHDNDRFLHNYGNWDNLNGALIFTLFYKGIPIVYYGDEQGYGGGSDPNNREPLWTHMSTSTSIYQVLKRAIKARKEYKVWEGSYQEKYVTDHLFAFTRGNLLCIFTAGSVYQELDIPNLPSAWGKVCNVLLDNPDSDCVSISGGKGHFKLDKDITKVYGAVWRDNQEPFPSLNLKVAK